jgi:hypothetical protein
LKSSICSKPSAVQRRQLRAAGEEDRLRDRHAKWIVALFERLGPDTNGPDQPAALQRLYPELVLPATPA